MIYYDLLGFTMVLLPANKRSPSTQIDHQESLPAVFQLGYG